MKIGHTKIKPWMIVAGAVGVLWLLNRPKTGAAQGTVAAGSTAAGGFDAGRHPHHGGHHHFRGLRGPVAPSWSFVGTDYAPDGYCECLPPV